MKLDKYGEYQWLSHFLSAIPWSSLYSINSIILLFFYSKFTVILNYNDWNWIWIWCIPDVIMLVYVIILYTILINLKEITRWYYQMISSWIFSWWYYIYGIIFINTLYCYKLRNSKDVTTWNRIICYSPSCNDHHVIFKYLKGNIAIP